MKYAYLHFTGLCDMLCELIEIVQYINFIAYYSLCTHQVRHENILDTGKTEFK